VNRQRRASLAARLRPACGPLAVSPYGPVDRLGDRQKRRCLVEVTLTCECGYVAKGSDDDELIVVARTHALVAHHVDLTDDVIRCLPREPSVTEGTGRGDLR
jgi:predicted small metal-binding protein